MKSLAFAGALALILSTGLAGCNNASTSAAAVTVQTDIATAISVICPVEASIQAAMDAGTLAAPNSNVKSAMATLAAVCPPNLPPTNLVTATIDLIDAYAAIQPLLASIKK